MYTPELVAAAMQEREREVAQLLRARREEANAPPRYNRLDGGLRAISARISRIACAAASAAPTR